MTLPELRSKLIGSGLSDILLPGFIDQDETPGRFRPIYQTVYFECGPVYLKMECVSTNGMLRISTADKIEMPVQMEEEELMAAVMSLREQCMDDADGSNGLSVIRLWDVREDETGLRCAAAQLELMNGQQIFVDPTYHFGMRIGGSRQRDIWFENWPAATRASEHVVRLVDVR
jgi:hypothetical protein